jgi:hypothetical protein
VTVPTLEAVDPAEIRARRRPGAVVLVFLWELAWALVVATPVHAWATSAWGAHPDGDAVLWLPGGRDLLVWLGQEDAALGVVADLARVAIARDVALRQEDRSALGDLRAGIVAALGTTRRAFGRAFGAWSWRAALSLLLLGAGAKLGDAVGARGGAALVGLFVAHQIVVLVRTALRASWLANALRLIGGRPPTG